MMRRDRVGRGEDNVGDQRQGLEAQREGMEGGGGSEADGDQTDARAGRARNTLIETLQDLRVSEAIFTRIVGSFPGNDLSYPEFPGASLPGEPIGRASCRERVCQYV